MSPGYDIENRKRLGKGNLNPIGLKLFNLKKDIPLAEYSSEIKSFNKMYLLPNGDSD